MSNFAPAYGSSPSASFSGSVSSGKPSSGGGKHPSPAPSPSPAPGAMPPKFLHFFCHPREQILRQPLDRLLKIIAALYVLGGLGSLATLPFFAATLKLFEAGFTCIISVLALTFSFVVWKAVKLQDAHKALVAVRLLFAHFAMVCLAYAVAVFFFPLVTIFIWTTGIATGGISLLIFAGLAVPCVLAEVFLTLFVYYVLWSFEYFHGAGAKKAPAPAAAGLVLFHCG